MGRGLFSGVIWGSVFAVMGLWLLSQLGGVVGALSRSPTEVATLAPAGSDAPDSQTAAEVAVVPDATQDPSPVPTPDGNVLADAQTEANPVVPAAPEGGPVPGTATLAPAATDPDSTRTSNAAAPVTANDQLAALEAAQQPQAPPADSAPQISSPPSAGLSPVGPVAEPTSPTAPLDVTGNSNAPSSGQTSSAGNVEPTQPTAPAADVVTGNSFTQPTVVVTPTDEPAPEEVAAIDAPAAEVSTPVKPGPAPRKLETGTEGGLAPSEGIGDLANNVRTHRLPTIGTAPKADEAETQPEDPSTADPRAIAKFAAASDVELGQPMMAIILLPDAAGDPGPATSAKIPFPIAYAVDASQGDAPEMMRSIRENGQEVVVLAPLPKNAAPADVEQAFQAYLNSVPEAVAVLDTSAAEFQSGRQVATQVVEALAASGHGMITYARGFNSAIQASDKFDVPATVVFRSLDDGGEGGLIVKRVLDSAAFRAGQQSGVILVGHNRPETIKALLEWSISNRASTVALAPVSVVLLNQ